MAKLHVKRSRAARAARVADNAQLQATSLAAGSKLGDELLGRARPLGQTLGGGAATIVVPIRLQADKALGGVRSLLLSQPVQLLQLLDAQGQSFQSYL